VQELQRYGDSKLTGTVWLAKGWAVHGDSQHTHAIKYVIGALLSVSSIREQ